MATVLTERLSTAGRINPNSTTECEFASQLILGPLWGCWQRSQKCGSGLGSSPGRVCILDRHAADPLGAPPLSSSEAGRLLPPGPELERAKRLGPVAAWAPLWGTEHCPAPSGHEVCTQHTTKRQEPFPGKHLQGCPAPESPGITGPLQTPLSVSSAARAIRARRRRPAGAQHCSARRGPGGGAQTDARAEFPLPARGRPSGWRPPWPWPPRLFWGKTAPRRNHRPRRAAGPTPSPHGLSEHQPVPALVPSRQIFIFFLPFQRSFVSGNTGPGVPRGFPAGHG